MKQFAAKVILHTILIVLLSIGSYLLFQKHLWFSVSICVLLLIVTSMSLYRMQFKQISLLRRLTDSLRYNDLMQTFHPPFKNKIMDEWSKELSEALKDFRERLLVEEVKHQYYENLLNKVDTAVLVTDKTGYIEWMNQTAIDHLGPIVQLPENLQRAAIAPDTSVVRLEQNGTILEMAISCTIFTSTRKEHYQLKKYPFSIGAERNGSLAEIDSGTNT